MSNIEKWLEQLLTYRDSPLEKDNEEIQKKVDEIEKLAENIEAGLSYNDLCWLLAEKILKETYKMGTPLSIRDTSEKAEVIFHNNLSYAELCWLNGELDIIIKKFFDKE